MPAYDAINECWIDETEPRAMCLPRASAPGPGVLPLRAGPGAAHTGKKPVSGAAAELRSTQPAKLHNTRTGESPAVTSAPAVGHPVVGVVVDALTVITGMAVFCFLAGFFWVLA